MKEIDIISNCGYPANQLSNFANHPFILDGILCNSFEGFVQSIKTMILRNKNTFVL